MDIYLNFLLCEQSVQVSLPCRKQVQKLIFVLFIYIVQHIFLIFSGFLDLISEFCRAFCSLSSLLKNILVVRKIWLYQLLWCCWSFKGSYHIVQMNTHAHAHAHAHTHTHTVKMFAWLGIITYPFSKFSPILCSWRITS